MDGSTLGLMEDLDQITVTDDQPTDFSMRVLSRKKTELGLTSVSHGLERSISNAVERNVRTAKMDLFEVRKKETTSIRTSWFAVISTILGMG